MQQTPSTRRALGPRVHVLMFLVGLMSATELLQSAMVSYTAAPVMGELGASPEEYSGVATMYAVISIIVIAKHRWLIERLGWRTFLNASAAAFALGAIVCATAKDMTGFVAGRAIMALGGPSFFTAARVLINRILDGPTRFAGIRRLALGLAAGTTLGPILATLAVAYGSWRWSYGVPVAFAAIIAAVSSSHLVDEPTPEHVKTRTRPGAVIHLMLGCVLMLYALQRSVFDWYGNSGEVTTCFLAGVALLAWFVRREAAHATPLLRLGRLGQPRYVLGLSMFALCYLCIAMVNYVMPVMLAQGLGLPLQAIGFYLGIGSAGGILGFLLIGNLLPRLSLPQPFYLAVFGLLLGFALAMSRLSEVAAPLADVVPGLGLFGAFVIVGLTTTAFHTYRDVQADEAVFTHANQLKNMVSQLCTAAGIALATLILQWRESAHWTQLVETLDAENATLGDVLGKLTRALTTATGEVDGRQRAIAWLGQTVTREAVMLGSLDFFQIVAAAAAVGLGGMTAWWIATALRARSPAAVLK